MVRYVVENGLDCFGASLVAFPFESNDHDRIIAR